MNGFLVYTFFVFLTKTYCLYHGTLYGTSESIRWSSEPIISLIRHYVNQLKLKRTIVERLLTYDQKAVCKCTPIFSTDKKNSECLLIKFITFEKVSLKNSLKVIGKVDESKSVNLIASTQCL